MQRDEPFQTCFKHKMEAFTKTAIDYFGKKLYIMYLIGGVSKFTTPDPQPPYFLHRINTFGPKIRPGLKKFILYISKGRQREKLIFQK